MLTYTGGRCEVAGGDDSAKLAKANRDRQAYEMLIVRLLSADAAQRPSAAQVYLTYADCHTLVCGNLSVRLLSADAAINISYACLSTSRMPVCQIAVSGRSSAAERCPGLFALLVQKYKY
jgi:hypothetical protein